MKSALKGLGLIAVLLLIAGIAIFTIARLSGPTKSQRVALSLMQATSESTGRNGFAALWLLPYDVPKTEQEAVTRQDVQRYAQTQPIASMDPAEIEYKAFTSIAESRYPDLRKEDNGSVRYCSWRDEDCLDKVRADPQTYAVLLERDASLLEHVAAFSEYDYVRNPFSPGLDMPFPAYQLLSRTMTQNAYWFVTGEVDLALAGVCRDAATGRMLVRSGDNLIGSMIGVAMLQGSGYQFAAMLSRIPADHPLPENCQSAFALPLQEELDVCSAMRGEFRFMSGGMARGMQAQRKQSTAASIQMALTYNEEKTIAMQAADLARWCGEEARSKVLRDIPAEFPEGPGTEYAPWSLQCIDNAMGCILNQIAAPSYSNYQLRLQDSGARLRTIGALLWLRENQKGSASLHELVSKLPPEFNSDHRTMKLAGDGSSLVVSMFETERNDSWRIPLPPYLVERVTSTP